MTLTEAERTLRYRSEINLANDLTLLHPFATMVSPTKKGSAMKFIVSYGTYDRPERVSHRYETEAEAERKAFNSLGAEVDDRPDYWTIEIARVYREVEGQENELLNEFEF